MHTHSGLWNHRYWSHPAFLFYSWRNSLRKLTWFVDSYIENKWHNQNLNPGLEPRSVVFVHIIPYYSLPHSKQRSDKYRIVTNSWFFLFFRPSASFPPESQPGTLSSAVPLLAGWVFRSWLVIWHLAQFPSSLLALSRRDNEVIASKLL